MAPTSVYKQFRGNRIAGMLARLHHGPRRYGGEGFLTGTNILFSTSLALDPRLSSLFAAAGTARSQAGPERLRSLDACWRSLANRTHAATPSSRIAHSDSKPPSTHYHGRGSLGRRIPCGHRSVCRTLQNAEPVYRNRRRAHFTKGGRLVKVSPAKKEPESTGVARHQNADRPWIPEAIHLCAIGFL